MKSYLAENSRWVIGGRQLSPAIKGGSGLLIMAVLAGIAYGAIHGQLVVPGNAGLSAANISAAPLLWTLEIVLWHLIAVLDIIVSVALLRLFLPVSRKLAAWMAGIRLFYTLILIIAIAMLFYAYSPASAAQGLRQFETIWYFGLVFFGVHLMLLGLLSLRSSFMPWLLSALLLIAGPSYTLIHLLFLLGGDYVQTGQALNNILMLPMTLAELGLAVWLIYLYIRGRSRAGAHATAA